MPKLGSKSAYWYVTPADLLTTVCVASPKLTRADTCLQMLLREHARTSTLAKLKQVWFSLYLWLSATKALGITYKTHVRSLQRVQRRQMDPRTQVIAQQGVPGLLVCLMNLNRVPEKLATWKYPYTQTRKACSHQPKNPRPTDNVYTVTALLQPNTTGNNEVLPQPASRSWVRSLDLCCTITRL